jgi:hypothetical protein
LRGGIVRLFARRRRQIGNHFLKRWAILPVSRSVEIVCAGGGQRDGNREES